MIEMRIANKRVDKLNKDKNGIATMERRTPISGVVAISIIVTNIAINVSITAG